MAASSALCIASDAGGQDRVSCQEEDGRTRSFPTAWTNFADEDAFVRVSAGRSSFRVADLLELADVIDRAKAGEGVRCVKGITPHL